MVKKVYDNSKFAFFFDHDKEIENINSWDANYTLMFSDFSLSIYKSNNTIFKKSLSTKLKSILKTIEYNKIESLEIIGEFKYGSMPYLIKHIYDYNPTGIFFETDTIMTLIIKTIENDKYIFSFNNVCKVGQVLSNIIKENKIEYCDNPSGFLNDLCLLSNVELYEKYIKPNVKFDTFIKKY